MCSSLVFRRFNNPFFYQAVPLLLSSDHSSALFYLSFNTVLTPTLFSSLSFFLLRVCVSQSSRKFCDAANFGMFYNIFIRWRVAYVLLMGTLNGGSWVEVFFAYVKIIVLGRIIASLKISSV